MSDSLATAAPAARRRQLVVATVTLAVASFSHGLTMPLLSLVLDRQGVDETLIGLNAGAYFIAVFAAAPLASRVLRARGPASLMLASILATAGLLALLRAFPDVWLWFPLRFVLGMAASFLWIAGEAWMNHAAAESHRGRIIAVFGVVVSAGFALGPLILSMTGAHGWAPFLVTIALLLVAAAVLARRPRGIPEAGGTDLRNPRALRAARAGGRVRILRLRRRRRDAAHLPSDLRGGARRRRGGRDPPPHRAGPREHGPSVPGRVARGSGEQPRARRRHGGGAARGVGPPPVGDSAPRGGGRRRLHVRLRRGARRALHPVPDTGRPAVPGRRPRRRIRDARGHVLHRLVPLAVARRRGHGPLRRGRDARLPRHRLRPVPRRHGRGPPSRPRCGGPTPEPRPRLPPCVPPGRPPEGGAAAHARVPACNAVGRRNRSEP